MRTNALARLGGNLKIEDYLDVMGKEKCEKFKKQLRIPKVSKQPCSQKENFEIFWERMMTTTMMMVSSMFVLIKSSRELLY